MVLNNALLAEFARSHASADEMRPASHQLADPGVDVGDLLPAGVVVRRRAAVHMPRAAAGAVGQVDDDHRGSPSIKISQPGSIIRPPIPY